MPVVDIGPVLASHFHSAVTLMEPTRYEAQVSQLAAEISSRLLSSCPLLTGSELGELATGMDVIQLKYLHHCTPASHERRRRFDSRTQ